MNGLKKMFVAVSLVLGLGMASVTAAPAVEISTAAVAVEQIAAPVNVALDGVVSFANFFATIDLSGFTDSLDEVQEAVTTALPDIIAASLAIAGVILGGMLLYKFFRRIVKA